MISNLLPFGAMAAAMLLVGCTSSPLKRQPTAAAAGNDRTCLTGTRIPSGPCGPAGRVYTDEDMQSTGASTTAEALRLLDPSIIVRR